MGAYEDKEQLEHIIKTYQAAKTDDERAAAVVQIAEDIGKNVQSVRAKLVREGVYIARSRRAKDGSPIETKGSMVDRIDKKYNLAFTDSEALSLEKATKSTLRKLLGE
jgi:hypothetical protein